MRAQFSLTSHLWVGRHHVYHCLVQAPWWFLSSSWARFDETRDNHRWVSLRRTSIPRSHGWSCCLFRQSHGFQLSSLVTPKPHHLQLSSFVIIDPFKGIMMNYPLVMTNSSLLKMAQSKYWIIYPLKMVDLSIAKCKRWPEGNSPAGCKNFHGSPPFTWGCKNSWFGCLALRCAVQVFCPTPDCLWLLSTWIITRT